MIILGNDRRKVTLIPLTIFMAWYYYSDLFHESYPFTVREKGMSLLGMLGPVPFKRYFLTEPFRLRVTMPLEIIHRRAQANHSAMRRYAL